MLALKAFPASNQLPFNFKIPHIWVSLSLGKQLWAPLLSSSWTLREQLSSLLMFASKQAGFCTNRANHVPLVLLSAPTKLLLSSSCRGVARRLDNHRNRGALEGFHASLRSGASPRLGVTPPPYLCGFQRAHTSCLLREGAGQGFWQELPRSHLQWLSKGGRLEQHSHLLGHRFVAARNLAVV